MADSTPAVMRTPRSVDVELTARCNLRCAYCYFFDNDAVEYRDLPAEEWLRFFEECGRLGVMSLTLAGGEPFMRKDLRVLLDGIVRNRMRYSLLSNGGLIDDEIAAFIAGTRRCDYVQVSVDGSRPETHDSCRGKGSFERAVRGIRTLQRHGVPAAVRVTIHRHNVDDLEATARFLLEELGLPGFGTNSAGYLGACRGNAGDILLDDRAAATGHGDPAAPGGALPRAHLGHRRTPGGGAHVARDGRGPRPGRPGLLERRPPDRLRLPQQQDRRARRRRHRHLLDAGAHGAGVDQPRLAGRGVAAQPGAQPDALASHHFA